MKKESNKQDQDKKKNKTVYEVPNIEVLESSIYFFLEEFKQKNNIEDLKKEPQNIFNAGLIYISRQMFPANYFKLKENIYNQKINTKNNNLNDSNMTYKDYIDSINNPNKLESNCNTYDFNLINNIYNIYKNICLLNNKEISLISFSYLTNIPYSSIKRWGIDTPASRGNISKAGCDFYKKVIEDKQESIESSGKADLLTMAKLNHYFGWSVQGIQKAEVQHIESIENLPKLSLNDGQTGQSLPDHNG